MGFIDWILGGDSLETALDKAAEDVRHKGSEWDADRRGFTRGKQPDDRTPPRPPKGVFRRGRQDPDRQW